MADLDDYEVLSQFGNRINPAAPGVPFRRMLRDCDSDGMSMLRGQVSPDQAASFVTHRSAALPGEGVRYTTVARLRAAGFYVKATPSKRIKLHVSVIMVVGEQWTEEVAQRFDSCFEGMPKVWKEEA